MVETKYYSFAGQRVAMRRNGVLTYLHSDHLGSTVLETNPSAALRASASGAMTTDETYFAYGKQRDSGKVVTRQPLYRTEGRWQRVDVLRREIL